MSYHKIENLYRNPDALTLPEKECYAMEKVDGCLDGESLVMLPNGEEVPIRLILERSDITQVLSYDVKTATYVAKPITNKFKSVGTGTAQWVRVHFENGNSLVCTDNHPIFSRDRQAYVNAADLLENEIIESPITED